MRTLSATVSIGLGDIIYFKAAFDRVKSEFSEIRLNFHRHIIGSAGRNLDYNKFLDDIGQLFFSEPPYVISNTVLPLTENTRIYTDNKISPCKPELGYLLCKGTPLDLGEPYIVLTTKLRYFPRPTFDQYANGIWEILKELSQKHKIVVLGEREVEMNTEYLCHTSNIIYSIYDDIMANIPKDRLVDLTIPALGITSPSLSQIQQDCLIMREAKFVMTLGVGGNFCMATAVANTIGYRVDGEEIADMIFAQTYPNAIITKDWSLFSETLKSYV
jgi:hypothetical protein